MGYTKKEVRHDTAIIAYIYRIYINIICCYWNFVEWMKNKHDEDELYVKLYSLLFIGFNKDHFSRNLKICCIELAAILWLVILQYCTFAHDLIHAMRHSMTCPIKRKIRKLTYRSLPVLARQKIKQIMKWRIESGRVTTA